MKLFDKILERGQNKTVRLGDVTRTVRNVLRAQLRVLLPQSVFILFCLTLRS